jgi:hypothetical protein
MTIEAFIKESWDIEQAWIGTPATEHYARLVRNFLRGHLGLENVIVLLVQLFREKYELRSRDVPPGSPGITEQLDRLLQDAPLLTAYELYCRFQALHPFTGGNGHIGRLIWLHKMGGNVDMLFLRAFHLQALEAFGERVKSHGSNAE